MSAERIVFNKNQFLIDLSLNQLLTYGFLQRYGLSAEMNLGVLKNVFYRLAEIQLKSTTLNKSKYRNLGNLRAKKNQQITCIKCWIFSFHACD